MSHQIATLEQQLEAKLFVRRAHAVALTDLGAELLERVDPLLVALDDVVERFGRRARAARPRSLRSMSASLGQRTLSRP